jgi:hypothetical protein
LQGNEWPSASLGSPCLFRSTTAHFNQFFNFLKPIATMKKSMKTTGHSNPSIANFQTFEISISQQQSVRGGGDGDGDEDIIVQDVVEG